MAVHHAMKLGMPEVPHPRGAGFRRRARRRVSGVSGLDIRRGGITIRAEFHTMETKSTGVGRFTVSLPQGLLEDLDGMAKEKGYNNRSLLIADMVRGWLVEHRQQYGDREIAGTITLVYDHHKPHLQEVLTSIQHDHHEAIISTLHVHLDHHNCLEVLVLRGTAAKVRKMADALIGAKGVKHGKLTITTTGKDLAG